MRLPRVSRGRLAAFGLGLALGAIGALELRASLGRLRMDRVTSQFRAESQRKGLRELAVTHSAMRIGASGTFYSPRRFATSRSLYGGSINVRDHLFKDPSLAVALLRDPQPSVRAWTALLLVDSDRSLDDQVSDEIQRVVLSDPVTDVRLSTLAAFDDPFSFTPPHLILHAKDLLATFSGDPEIFDWLVYLIGRQRCLVTASPNVDNYRLQDTLVARIGSQVPARRLESYEALRQLLGDPDLAREVILRLKGPTTYFNGTVFAMFAEGPPAQLATVVSDIRASLHARRELAKRNPPVRLTALPAPAK